MPVEVENIHKAMQQTREQSRLNYWIILCPKCPLFALTYTEGRATV